MGASGGGGGDQLVVRLTWTISVGKVPVLCYYNLINSPATSVTGVKLSPHNVRCIVQVGRLHKMYKYIN